MNTFELNVFDDEGSVCTFYTVQWEDAALGETEKFFAKYEADIQFKQALQELTKFIFNKIADDTGALEVYFRFENLAHALPPSGKFIIDKIIINYGNFPLRLYCLRISEQLVVLFNGAEKTSEKAKDGKTSMVFDEANKFAKRILQALNDREIFISNTGREFVDDEGNTEHFL